MVKIFDKGSPHTDAHPPTSNGMIEETEESRFMSDVIEASLSTPIVTLFYKQGSDACRKLESSLHQLVGGRKDLCRLFKVNIDSNRNLAMQLRLQSVPSVFAFDKGQLVDGFVGALTEDVLRKFLEKLCGGSLKTASDLAAEFIAAGDSMVIAGAHDEALRAFSKALDEDEGNLVAISRLVKLHADLGNLSQADSLLASVGEDDLENIDISSARAALDLARQGNIDSSEITILEEKIAENGDDYESRFSLALALNGLGRRLDAVEHLIFIVTRNRDWNGGMAHDQLLQFFSAWGFNDTATIEGRRRLSRILFS